uniref:1-phosphatidylinositol 4-kinase n=1 Tax=Leersia perrieri TaxID=77586 RepID=A0A0D9WKH0_9ORYZ
MTTAAGAAISSAAAGGVDEQQEILLPIRPPPPSHDFAAESRSIVIYITAPGVTVMPMRVMVSDFIASVKLRVQRWRGFLARKQRLVFAGRELARNECRIGDYGVGDGTMLHLVVRVSDLRLITVVNLRGEELTLRLHPGRTVGYVKRQIVDIDADHSLVLHGEVLDDAHLIHDVCRSDGAVIHLRLVRRRAMAPRGGEPGRPKSKSDFGIEPVIVNPKASPPSPSVIENMVAAVLAGMDKGNAPIMSSEGTGGAYLMPDATGQEHVAVFKPVDEEPMAANNPRGLPESTTGEGLKKGTRVGEGAIREVAAYILDHPTGGRRSFAAGHHGVGFAGVAPTAMVRCMHRSFKQPVSDQELKQQQQPVTKIGSLQAFVKNSGSCEDMGPRDFPVHEVHKICVLDIRLANADRHAGNILICREEGSQGLTLIPIDHGYCLPESFEDCTFEWLYWPQCRELFSEETVNYIRSLDAEEDIAILRFHGWEMSPKSVRVLRITTMLFKKGVERGLTAFDMGSIMCRETLTKESGIEEIIREAEDEDDGENGDEGVFLQSVSEIMDRRLDELSKKK